MLRDIFRWKKEDPLDSLIMDVLSEMKQRGASSAEYLELMTKLERLSEIKVNKARDPLSRDTVALILGNLVGILLIVAYEQKHVISSKGFDRLPRPR